MFVNGLVFFFTTNRGREGLVMPDIATIEYKVKKGDNLWKIVKAHGFPPKDWEKIYNASYNEAFKKDHKNPDVIHAGDVFVLPKYNVQAMNVIMLDMGTAEAKLKELITKQKKLSEDIKKILKEREPDLKKIEKLKKEAKTLADLADSAADVCSDMYSCIGAGLVSQKFSNKAKAARKEVDSIKKKMDAKGTKKALENMQKQLTEAGKEIEKTQAEVKKFHAEWKKAEKKPY